MPVFDTIKRPGAIQVGNTPGSPLSGNDYDTELLALLPLWYSVLSPAGAENPPIWLTYAQAIINTAYDYPGWGPYFVEAWVDEHLVPLGTDWPSYATAITDDAARVLGPYWFDAWYNWLSPVLSYDDMLDNQIAPIWSSRLNTTGVAEPIGGTITTAGGFRTHTFLSGGAWPAFYVGTDITMLIDVLYVGGGAPGGRYGSGNAGGGGGAGEYFAVNGYSATDVCEALVGAATTGISSPVVPNGKNTVFDGNTAQGGGIGGHIALATVNGSAGGSGGGGSATTTPSSGTGGAGGTGGTAGGSGWAPPTTPAGGGGGGRGSTGGNATLTNGGNGGDGLVWHDGLEYAHGGGGARSSAAGSGGGVGGNGGTGTNGNGGAAVANRGSGGGGSRGTRTPGTGSAGIVKIRYPYP